MNQSSEKTSRHIFTVDVEEYFQVEAFSEYVKRKDWDRYPGRVEESTARLLDLLSDYGVRGTFFVLGWLAERNPALVKRIAGAGHEIGSHGFEHRMITKMTPEEFRKDIRKSREVLENIIGIAVEGYRAPTFSIVNETRWAYNILLEEGFHYSSSVFPTLHDRYGWRQFGYDPRKMASNKVADLWEIPLSVWVKGPIKIPFGGGGYLRSYPIFLTKTLFRNFSKKGKPVILYIHPWELDSQQPKIRAPLISRGRHLLGIQNTERKLIALLKEIKFTTISQYLNSKKFSFC